MLPMMMFSNMFIFFLKRLGRVGPVNVRYILAMDTLDGVQWPMVKKKLKIVGQALGMLQSNN